MCVVEVVFGIVCLGVVSVLILLLSFVKVLMCLLSVCYVMFVVFMVGVLVGDVVCGDFEWCFVDFVDDIVGFEVNCVFVLFEDLYICVCSCWFVWLNSEFMNVCMWLYVLY